METFMKEAEESMNCRCVPSPQSKSNISEPTWTTMALTLRCGVGRLPPVPKNIRRTAVHWPATIKSLPMRLVAHLSLTMKMTKPTMAMTVARYMQPWYP